METVNSKLSFPSHGSSNGSRDCDMEPPRPESIIRQSRMGPEILPKLACPVTDGLGILNPNPMFFVVRRIEIVAAHIQQFPIHAKGLAVQFIRTVDRLNPADQELGRDEVFDSLSRFRRSLHAVY